MPITCDKCSVNYGENEIACPACGAQLPFIQTDPNYEANKARWKAAIEAGEKLPQRPITEAERAAFDEEFQKIQARVEEARKKRHAIMEAMSNELGFDTPIDYHGEIVP